MAKPRVQVIRDPRSGVELQRCIPSGRPSPEIADVFLDVLAIRSSLAVRYLGRFAYSLEELDLEFEPISVGDDRSHT